MSKQQMLAAMKNKKAITVSWVVHKWFGIYGVMGILQSDNGSKFKKVYLTLETNFDTRVINGRPRILHTHSLVEQSNGTVKI